MTLSVQGLTIELGGSRVVDGVSFDVPDGARIGIIGESGSGKSLTALAIMGLLPHGARTTGSVRWNGREILGIPDRELAKLRGSEIGMVFQEPQTALNPIRRVGRQIAEAARIHRGVRGRDADGLAIELARSVGLSRPEEIVRRYPHQLSGGQRQRVGIAAALAADPRLIIADEPTTALDVTVQKGVLELLTRVVAERDASLAFITHDLAVLAQVATHAIVMERGRIVEAGAVADLLTAPTHPVTRGLLNDSKATLWRKHD